MRLAANGGNPAGGVVLLFHASEADVVEAHEISAVVYLLPPINNDGY